MTDIRQAVDALSSWLRESIPAQYAPGPTLWAIVLLAAGAMLAARGARMLRLLYTLVFIVAGAAVGVHIARSEQVDVLIGLVLGAGLAALVGHLFFRWWVGVTIGVAALLALGAVAGPQYLPAGLQPLRNHLWAPAGRDHRASEGGVVLLANRPAEGLSLNEASASFSDQWHSMTPKELVLAGLAFLCGLGCGLIFPRFSILFGTSFVGVLAIILGAGTLVTIYRADWWDALSAHPPWLLGGVAGLFLLSLIAQGSRPRIAPATPVAPAPMPAAA